MKRNVFCRNACIIKICISAHMLCEMKEILFYWDIQITDNLTWACI
jgi:hypothetical protein